MPFVEILRVAAESIRSNLFRAVLTMLGVIIGVAAVITMLALGTGAQRAVEQQLQSLGANIVTVTTGMRFMLGVSRADQTLTVDDAHALEADARYVTAVVPELQRRQQLKLGSRNVSVQVIGTAPSYPDVNGFSLAAGRMFSVSDDVARRRVVVMGGEVPTQLETTAEALIGRMVYIRSIPFEVIGVFEKKGAIGFMNPDNQVWVPLSTMQYRVAGDDKLSSINVQVLPGAQVAQAMVEIERVLRRTHGILPGRDNDFSIIDRKQFLATQQQATQVFGFLLAGIASVSLVVGGIGIMNIMLVSVTERTREIGIRKALGARRSTILLQFLIESIVLCVLGGVLGILLGTGVAALLAKFAGWQTYVSWDAVALAFGFSAGVGLVFGLWPAQRAARLEPIEALRHE